MSRIFQIYIRLLILLYFITLCFSKKPKSTKKCGIKLVAIEQIKFQKVPVMYPEAKEPEEQQYLLHHHQEYQQQVKDRPNNVNQLLHNEQNNQNRLHQEEEMNDENNETESNEVQYQPNHLLPYPYYHYQQQYQQNEIPSDYELNQIYKMLPKNANIVNIDWNQAKQSA